MFSYVIKVVEFTLGDKKVTESDHRLIKRSVNTVLMGGCAESKMECKWSVNGEKGS